MGANEIEILLVEDNPDDVELALHALRRENLSNRIQVVRDGGNAYKDRSIQDRPKVVLLDLKLPKVDGAEVLRAIKADPRTRTIPVVVLTSSKEEKDLIESYHLGANSYIQKPVDIEKFRDTIKQLGLYWLVVNVLPPPETSSKTEAQTLEKR
jgi:CheY-like chemotaxis protein